MKDLHQAVTILSNSGVLLYPTDTIWGLGCDARDAEAIQKIIEIKKRPKNKSFIILAKSWDQMQQYTSQSLSLYRPYFDKYSDRPTSFILDVAYHLPDVLKHEQDHTIAVRIPNSLFCNQLFDLFDAPIVSTSANTSGAPSPGEFEDIEPSIKSSVDFIVPSSFQDSKNRVSSRIVKISNGEEFILRNG
jgi:L-threonylcarbamoyladenylate synthase